MSRRKFWKKKAAVLRVGLASVLAFGLLWSANPALADTPVVDSRIAVPISVEAFPETDSVLLLDDIKFEVLPDRTSVFDEHDAVKVLTKEGVEENANLVRVIDTSKSSVQVLFARTVKADGRTVPADPPQYSPLAGDSKAYKNIQRFSIRFPELDVGDAIEFHIRTTHKPKTDGHFWATTYVQNPMPILDSTFTVTVPEDVSFRTGSPGNPEAKPQESRIEKDGVAYRKLYWGVKNENAYRYENLAPKTVTLLKRIEVSSFESWEQMAEFIEKEWKKESSLPEGLALRVAGWMPTTGDVASRAAALVKELNKKRQVASFLAEQPEFHPPVVIFNEELVSSPDVSLLTSVALSGAGIPNIPVITFGVSSLSLKDELPIPDKINKIVLEIPRSGSPSLWFDPEAPAFVSEILPTNTSDTAALSWDERFQHGKEVRDLAITPALANREELALEGRLETSGTAELTLQFDRYGALAFDSRQAARDIRDGAREARERALQNFFRNTTRAYGPRARLLGRYFELDPDAADPFSLSFTVAVPGYAQVEDQTMIVPLPRFLPSAIRAAARERGRTTPLVFDQPYQQDVRIHLILPEGSRVQEPPASVRKVTPEAEFVATATASGNEVWYVGRLTVFDPWVEEEGLARSLQILEAALNSEDTILKVELPEAKTASEVEAEDSDEEDES